MILVVLRCSYPSKAWHIIGDSFSQRLATDYQSRISGGQSTIDEQVMARVKPVFEIEFTNFAQRMISCIKYHSTIIVVSTSRVQEQHSVSCLKVVSTISWHIIPFLEGKHLQGFSPSSFRFPSSAVQSVAFSLPFSLLSLFSYAPF